MKTHAPPTVWALIGPKPGDNNQIRALTDALGWPVIEKRMYYRPTELLSNRFLGPNLVGLDQRRSTPLKPPWPDLVISAGRRNEPAARWIRRAAGRHPVRLVHLGRPWASLAHFDLVVTTPQYHLPQRGNVLHNSLPLHRVHRDALAAAATRWAEQLGPLPRPYTALLAGGSSTNLVLDQVTTERLRAHAIALQRQVGGSLLVSTSRRTPAAAVTALQGAATATGDPPTGFFYRWRENDPDNPYLGFLALADRFIVTGESVSMLTEACATGKPVHIFCPGQGVDAGQPLPAAQRRGPRQRFKQFSNNHAPKRWRRDIGRIHRHLIEGGYAVWLGEPFDEQRPLPPIDDLARTVKRVRRLMHRP